MYPFNIMLHLLYELVTHSLILVRFLGSFIFLMHHNLNLLLESQNLFLICMHLTLQTILVPLQSCRLDFKVIYLFFQGPIFCILFLLVQLQKLSLFLYDFIRLQLLFQSSFHLIQHNHLHLKFVQLSFLHLKCLLALYFNCINLTPPILQIQLWPQILAFLLYSLCCWLN